LRWGATLLILMGEVTPAQYRRSVRALHGDQADAVLSLYPASSVADTLPALSRMLTEMGFAATARFAAACTSAPGRRSSAYLYQFSREPSVRVPGFPRGAFHGLEVAYVFGKMDTFGVRDPVDLRLSDEIVRLWTRFAARGDPNGTGEEVWPTYDPGTDRHLELGEALVVETGLYKAACDLADRIRLTP
jgi:para-nitrobenzyl esterase